MTASSGSSRLQPPGNATEASPAGEDNFVTPVRRLAAPFGAGEGDSSPSGTSPTEGTTPFFPTATAASSAKPQGGTAGTRSQEQGRAQSQEATPSPKLQPAPAGRGARGGGRTATARGRGRGRGGLVGKGRGAKAPSTKVSQPRSKAAPSSGGARFDSGPEVPVLWDPSMLDGGTGINLTPGPGSSGPVPLASPWLTPSYAGLQEHVPALKRRASARFSMSNIPLSPGHLRSPSSPSLRVPESSAVDDTGDDEGDGENIKTLWSADKKSDAGSIAGSDIVSTRPRRKSRSPQQPQRSPTPPPPKVLRVHGNDLVPGSGHRIEPDDQSRVQLFVAIRLAEMRKQRFLAQQQELEEEIAALEKDAEEADAGLAEAEKRLEEQVRMLVRTFPGLHHGLCAFFLPYVGRSHEGPSRVLHERPGGSCPRHSRERTAPCSLPAAALVPHARPGTWLAAGDLLRHSAFGCLGRRI